MYSRYGLFFPAYYCIVPLLICTVFHSNTCLCKQMKNIVWIHSKVVKLFVQYHQTLRLTLGYVKAKLLEVCDSVNIIF